MPTLDGWRAIAILSVIFGHDGIHAIGPFSTLWLYKYGSLGVDVFFAISGLLICSRLLDEERIYGKIHIKDFYVRRGFRILPPVFLYLGVATILSAFSVITVTKAELIECLLFCRNTTHFLDVTSAAGHWYTGHFWSLSLEEQFYFLLPTLLVLVATRYRAHVLGALTAAVVVHRALALGTRSWPLIEHHPDIRIDALLVPALIAILASSPQNRQVFQRYLRFWPLGVIVFLCLIPFGTGSAWQATVFIWLLPAIVLGSVLNPENIFGRLLEWRVLRYIGRISYSLYLWQQLFFTGHFLGNWHPLGWLQSWPMRLVMTFGIAVVSYHLLECPLTRLGRKLAPPATGGREALELPILNEVRS
jgi:peptidoglycan/LPS O-acetylase OafA/YrhL